MTALDAFRHPLIRLAVVGLLLNDHVLKSAFPGPLTGKLSDVAGLTFLPLLAVASLELASGGSVSARTSGRLIGIATALVAIAFVVAKTTPAGASIAGAVLGLAGYPIELGVAVFTGTPAALPHPGVVVMDPTDLIALPCVLTSVVLLRFGDFSPIRPQRFAIRGRNHAPAIELRG